MYRQREGVKVEIFVCLDVTFVLPSSSSSELSNPVANRYMWRQALLMWHQARFPHCYN
jgi:hypothetical protein